MKKITNFMLLLLLWQGAASYAQVGINTATPDPNVGLHIAENFEAIRLDGSSPSLTFYTGNTYRGYLFMSGDNMYMMNRRPGPLLLGTSNSLRMAINSDGDVGIGTTVPDLRLHVAEGLVSGATFNSNSIAGFEKQSGNGFISVLTGSNTERGLLFADELNSASGGIIYNNAATPNGLQFRTNSNNTRMAISDGGDVGIGKLNPNRPLHIKSRNGGDEYGLKIERSGSSTNWELSVFGGNFNFFYNGAATPTAVINTSGTYTSSDRRLKHDIKPYHEVLTGIRALQINSYRYNEDTDAQKEVVGLIAQEVAPHFPEIVQAMPNRSGEIYYAIDYGKTGILALKAIQELSDALEQQQQANERLMQRLKAMEDRLRDMEQNLL